MQTLSYFPSTFAPMSQPALFTPAYNTAPQPNTSLDVLSLLQNAEVLNTLSLLQSTAEKCEYCGTPLLFSREFLVHDNQKNKDLFVCSEICKQNWLDKLSQSIASLSSQILQNSAQLIQANTHSPVRQDIKSQAKSTQKKNYKAQRAQKQKAKRLAEVNEKRISTETSQPKATIEKKYFVVIDTNVLMTHFQEILNLKLLENITVVIPEIVIRDLDKMKKREGKDGIIARAALRTILEELKSTKSFIRCLNASEIASTHKINNNDDFFIGSFFHFQKNVKDALKEETLLVTNDNNLLSKSLMAGAQSLTLGDFQKRLPPVHSRAK